MPTFRVVLPSGRCAEFAEPTLESLFAVAEHVGDRIGSGKNPAKQAIEGDKAILFNHLRRITVQPVEWRERAEDPEAAAALIEGVRALVAAEGIDAIHVARSLKKLAAEAPIRGTVDVDGMLAAADAGEGGGWAHVTYEALVSKDGPHAWNTLFGAAKYVPDFYALVRHINDSSSPGPVSGKAAAELSNERRRSATV